METSLTLLVKALCSKEINMHAIQNTFYMAANLAFGVKVTSVHKSQNILD